MDRMAELDEMIVAGWGDMPGDQIPADWRTRQRQRQLTGHEAALLEELERGPEIEQLSAELAMENEARRNASRGRVLRKTPYKRKTVCLPLERKCAEMRERMRNQRRTA